MSRINQVDPAFRPELVATQVQEAQALVAAVRETSVSYCHSFSAMYVHLVEREVPELCCSAPFVELPRCVREVMSQ